MYCGQSRYFLNKPPMHAFIKPCKLYLLHVLWSVRILFEQTLYACLQEKILTNMTSDCLRGNSHFLGSDQGKGYPFYASEKTAVKTMRVTGGRNLQLIVRSKLWLGSKRLATINPEMVCMEGEHQIPKTTCFSNRIIYYI